MSARRIICESCAQKHLPAGERQIYARSAIGEPPEFQRLVVGVAKSPNPADRVIYVNGQPFNLPEGHFNCDQCDAVIEPGDMCAARTFWCEGQDKAEGWESDFITGEK